VPQLAVTTETDFGVTTPVTAAGGVGAGMLAAALPPPHPDIDPAAIKVKRAYISVFINRSPVKASRIAQRVSLTLNLDGCRHRLEFLNATECGKPYLGVRLARVRQPACRIVMQTTVTCF
jgi:hypothetical protein